MNRGAWALAIAGAAGCGEVFEAPVELDLTRDVSGFAQVQLDLAAPAEIRGGLGRELSIQGDLVVAAATQARADELAETYAVETSSAAEPYRITVPIPGDFVQTPFPEASVRGNLRITVPADVDLVVLEQGGALRVRGVRGQVDLQARGAVWVEEVVNNAKVAAASGGARVETRLRAGTNLDVTAVRGPVNVVLPPSPSVRITARAGEGRQVVVQHPDLPRRPGRRSYEVTAGGGSASVVADAFADNVLLLP
ncbi:MAG TPA: hypothetical protein RMG48_03815 [Myxococcales bacterium LLY-WYZ-16_1]|jgi:hypothetical protein|nr:hypothetical protein [Myxococcales bacterium LLY-WYZ-16_1]